MEYINNLKQIEASLTVNVVKRFVLQDYSEIVTMLKSGKRVIIYTFYNTLALIRRIQGIKQPYLSLDATSADVGRKWLPHSKAMAALNPTTHYAVVVTTLLPCVGRDQQVIHTITVLLIPDRYS